MPEKARNQGAPEGRGAVKNYPTVLFDNGHGGVIEGEYQTKGKRSPVWPDGRQLFEGEFNRAVVRRVIKMMKAAGYPYRNLVNTDEDMPLEDRTDKANDFYKTKSKECFLISVHANAGGGTGLEVFTSPGHTDADPQAEITIEELVKEFPELRLRADDEDGDHDKEARFWMVMQTDMPAFLIECAFMDTLDPDCELLMSEDGRDRFAKAIFSAIERIYEELY